MPSTRRALAGCPSGGAHHVRQTLFSRAGQLGDQSGGRALGELDQALGHLARGDRLHPPVRCQHDRADACHPVDLLRELVELGRAHLGPGDVAGTHQALLHHLAEVVAVLRFLAADDPEQHVVLHARGFLGGQQVARRRVEELGGDLRVLGELRDHVDHDIHPRSAAGRPSPVTRSTPVERVSTTASWPCSRSTSTTSIPTVPVPPGTAIFISHSRAAARDCDA